MSYFLGQVQLLPYGFAPYLWLECNGRLLKTEELKGLFALLGFQFGGNYPDTFALPNIAPLKSGSDELSYYIAAAESLSYIAPPPPARRPGLVPGTRGQIELFAFPFAPSGWMPCQGQLLPKPDNPLFALLGTRYGGDGKTTFALPDLAPVKTTDGKADLKWYISDTGPYPTQPDAFPEELLGSIELLPYDFSPPNFMMCDGRSLAIEEHPTLFSIIGTKFGGDGKKNFRLPKLAPLAAVNGQGDVGHFMCIAGIVPLRHQLG